MKSKSVFSLLIAMTCLTSCFDANGNFTTTSLLILGLFGFLIIYLYISFLVNQTFDWIAKQTRDGFNTRIRGAFYDWGCKMRESYPSLSAKCKSTKLVLPYAIELTVTIALLFIAVISHSYWWMYCLSLTLLASVVFTKKLMRVCDDSNVSYATYIALSVYVMVMVWVLVFTFVISLLEEFLSSSSSSSISYTSQSKSNTSTSACKGYSSESSDKLEDKQPYTVCYRYPSGSTIEDRCQVMYFSQKPTISDVHRYIQENSWGLDVRNITVYCILFGTGHGGHITESHPNNLLR